MSICLHVLRMMFHTSSNLSGSLGFSSSLMYTSAALYVYIGVGKGRVWEGISQRHLSL